MLFATTCATCRSIFRVIGRPEVLAQLFTGGTWPNGFPCVKSGCSGVAHPVPSSEALRGGSEIEAYAYYRALLGFGLCKGAPAEALVVRKLLLTKRVTQVSIEPVGSPERTIIHGLTLSNGTKLHFAPSGKGACIFYVEESQHAEDRHLPVEGDPLRSPSDPSEARQHPPQVDKPG